MKEEQMSAQATITEKMAVQGNPDALALVWSQVVEILGAEPTSWKWELGFSLIFGRVMIVTASR